MIGAGPGPSTVTQATYWWEAPGLSADMGSGHQTSQCAQVMKISGIIFSKHF